MDGSTSTGSLRRLAQSQQERQRKSRGSTGAPNSALFVGLLGLAITHTQLSPTDVSYICGLLSGPTSGAQTSAGGGGNASSGKRQLGSPDAAEAVVSDSGSQKSLLGRSGAPSAEMSTTPRAAARQRLSMTARPVPGRGLKYLDLGFCRLGDTVCVDVLKAAVAGPLQGLNLSGNFTLRGAPFLEGAGAILSIESLSQSLSFQGSSDSAASSSSSTRSYNNSNNITTGGAGPATPIHSQTQSQTQTKGSSSGGKLWGSSQAYAKVQTQSPTSPMQPYKGPYTAKLTYLVSQLPHKRIE
jgi:hypothetical protein